MLLPALIVLVIGGLVPVAGAQPRAPRVYETSRLSGPAPHIDGRLSDAVWQNRSGWTGRFVQQVPRQGEAPTQKTEFKILYDDRFIYVAIRAFDTEPDKIERQVARRDVLAGDMVGVAFDSYFDHLTAYEFNLTAAGAKIDLMHRGNKVFDETWDAVWDGATALEDSAWTAEMRIPLSQLRFSKKEEQVWGLHLWRWIHRYQEESQFNMIPIDATAYVPNFGELHGLKNIQPKRRIEVLPYTVARMSTFEPEKGNPFADGSRGQTGAGLDAKIGLSSAFTMDLTLNPDFGQVEADPSVMNLTAFETFYEEKRPFFLEGGNLFAYEFEGEQIFYSRRIGSKPRFTPSLDRGEYLRMPETTTILGAAKLTGKTENGLSVGILESLTSGERALVQAREGRYHEAVEPLTNYFVSRIEKEWGKGTTVLGGMVTAVNRDQSHDQLDFLPREGYTGGLNFTQYTPDRTYFVRLNLVGSEVRGSEEAITRLQRSSYRYYQRPDADYLDFDPGRTRLGGYGGSVEIGRAGNGRWRFAEEFSWQSPGLDFSEAGFMKNPSDRINLESMVSYEVNQPNRVFRSYAITADHSSEWNYGSEMNELFGRLRLRGQFNNYWRVSSMVMRSQGHWDMRMLRGGPSMRMPGSWVLEGAIQSDSRKRMDFGLSAEHGWMDGTTTRTFALTPDASWRVNQALSLSGSLTYGHNRDDMQYVAQKLHNGVYRYIFGRIDQQTVQMSLRLSYSLRPDLVIQFYGQPFISSGRYDRLKVVTDPRAGRYEDRSHVFTAEELSYDPLARRTQIDVDSDGIPDFVVADPDFTLREFRSNLVLRWEYRPGSNLYLVWSQMRTGSDTDGRFSWRDDLSRLYDIYPYNVFAIKLSHYFSAN